VGSHVRERLWTRFFPGPVPRHWTVVTIALWRPGSPHRIRWHPANPHPAQEQERASGLSNQFKRYGFIVL